MGYYPTYINPMNQQQGFVPSGFNQYTAPMSLTRVTGMDGAKAYQMPPNSTAALFDGEKDIFYVKSTDGGGYPTIRAFSFTPLQDAALAVTEYAAKADFEKLRDEFEQIKEALFNVKQPVRKTSKPSTEDE